MIPQPPTVRTRLILIGLRGSGKTSMGQALANSTGLPMVDLDDRTAALLDKPTAGTALRECGEAAFRSAEVQALKQALCEPKPAVLALGGGTPTAPGAAELLTQSHQQAESTIVYIRLTAKSLTKRLSTDTGDRPALQGIDPISEIPIILANRDDLYTKLASVVIDADDLDESALVRATLQAWA